MYLWCSTRMMIQPIVYSTDITGTSPIQTLVIHLMPPISTRPVRTIITMPGIHWGMLKFSWKTFATALDCTPSPIPKAARAAKRANSTPSHFILRPRSRANIAPPSIIPCSSLTRYFTAISDSAYFVAMPNTPVSHIQSTAPGPPEAMAVPTPIMLPVPMVEARAVVSAPNWDTSPAPSTSLVTESLMPKPSLRWIKPVLMVIKRWVPNSSTNSQGPHSHPSIVPTTFVNFSIKLLPFYLICNHSNKVWHFVQWLNIPPHYLLFTRFACIILQ